MSLSNTYLLLNLITISLLVFIGFRATATPKHPKRRRNLILGLLFWQIYIYLMASTGIFQDFSFPPKFVLFMIIPCFTFTGIFLYKKRKEDWILKIPPHWLAFYQSFRIVIESLFIVSVAEGILHPNVTFEGYNYDLIFGLSAPIIGWLVYKKKSFSLLKIWNYLGLTVIASIIFLFISTIYFPELYTDKPIDFPTEFGTYPYVLIAGFLMPSAVFIHILSLIQINRLDSSK